MKMQFPELLREHNTTYAQMLKHEVNQAQRAIHQATATLSMNLRKRRVIKAEMNRWGVN